MRDSQRSCTDPIRCSVTRAPVCANMSTRSGSARASSLVKGQSWSGDCEDVWGVCEGIGGRATGRSVERGGRRVPLRGGAFAGGLEDPGVSWSTSGSKMRIGRTGGSFSADAGRVSCAIGGLVSADGLPAFPRGGTNFSAEGSAGGWPGFAGGGSTFSAHAGRVSFAIGGSADGWPGFAGGGSIFSPDAGRINRAVGGSADGWPGFAGEAVVFSTDVGSDDEVFAAMEGGNGSCRGATFAMVSRWYMTGRGVADVVGLTRALFVFG